MEINNMKTKEINKDHQNIVNLNNTFIVLRYKDLSWAIINILKTLLEK